jgi:hypothetical protein
MKSIKTFESKLDYRTLHFLPFLPSRKREQMEIERKWGDVVFKAKAPESLNTYDLITLMFIIKEYLKQNWDVIEINGKETAVMKLNLVKLVKERGVLNKKINRKTFFESILRLSQINLFFIKNDKTHWTKYIFDIEYENDYKEIQIFANKKFIETVTNKGILVSLSNFLKLEKEANGRTEYAILLYAFMQGTKTKFHVNGRNLLKWREKYREDLLFRVLNLENTNLDKRKKREKIKEAFNVLHKNFDIPKYTYDKFDEMWVRVDLAEKRLNKVG